MSKSQPGIYKRLLGYTVRHKGFLIIAILAMVVSALTEPAFALLMKPLLNGSFVDQDASVTRWVAASLLLIFVLRGIATFVTSYYMAKIGWSVIKSLRLELFARYLSMPTAFFDHASSGQLISRITYNTEQVANAASDSLTQLVRDSLTVIGLLAVMIYLSWQMTLGFLFVAPLVTAIVVYVTRRFRRISRKIQGSMGDVTHITEEMVHGHRIIKVFNGQEYEQSHFEQANEKNQLLNLKMVVTKSASTPIVQAILGIVLVAVILFATSPSMKEHIDVGTFMSFMSAMMMLMAPVKRLTDVNATIQRGIAAGESIFTVLDSEQEKDTGTVSMETSNGQLKFEQVSFSYAGIEKMVLKDISFSAKKGQTIALVGMSGAGKSSLVNLLPRLYQVTEGRILLDGISIDDIKLTDLRNQIAYVGQEVTLFNDTVRNNIAYGRMQESSDEEIINAAKSANAWEFIQNMPTGLDTQVGEKGALLSGGQRQRIAIARALLKDAPLLILDEATAALDTESEKLIQKAIENLSRNRTTLVIAHRLKTIEHADRILVLEDGKIIEQGSHSELMKKKGRYTSLHNIQFSDKDS